MAETLTTDLPGVDLARLTTWLDVERPGLRTGELSGQVLAGGKSNLTYRITDGTSSWALRRPPLAHVLPTAHDMRREFRVINGLRGTAVPVPDAIALCEDPEVLGAQFYVMGFVDGLVLDKQPVLDAITHEQAHGCCELLMATLADLHAVDPESVGLGDFGRPEGFLARQMKRWHQQWQASQTQPRAELVATVDRLVEQLPEQSAPGIVHGDYRLTNVMFTRDFGAIAAVVDWEMATLGDPLADVGLNVVYQDLAQRQSVDGADTGVMPVMPADAGFMTAAQMVQAYGRHSDRDLSDINWYIAFGYFKLAVISEGIHHRYLAGKTVGEGFDHFGPQVPLLLQTALDYLDGH
jgi:aminoglycoside phosphotransferase (APT) family kinase protein